MFSDVLGCGSGRRLGGLGRGLWAPGSGTGMFTGEDDKEDGEEGDGMSYTDSDGGGGGSGGSGGRALLWGAGSTAGLWALLGSARVGVTWLLGDEHLHALLLLLLLLLLAVHTLLLLLPIHALLLGSGEILGKSRIPRQCQEILAVSRDFGCFLEFFAIFWVLAEFFSHFSAFHLRIFARHNWA